MKSRLAKTLRGLADSVDPSPLDDDRVSAPTMDRQGAALSLLDDECVGFFMLQVRTGDGVEVRVVGDVTEEYWQAVGITMHQVARMAYGVRY